MTGRKAITMTHGVKTWMTSSSLSQASPKNHLLSFWAEVRMDSIGDILKDRDPSVNNVSNVNSKDLNKDVNNVNDINNNIYINNNINNNAINDNINYEHDPYLRNRVCKMARDLKDSHSLGQYFHLLRQYGIGVLEQAFKKVVDTPDWEIKKSRGAYFLYLVKLYGLRKNDKI